MTISDIKKCEASKNRWVGIKRGTGMTEWRNGMGIKCGTEKRKGIGIKRGTERRNGMGIKRGKEWG